MILISGARLRIHREGLTGRRGRRPASPVLRLYQWQHQRRGREISCGTCPSATSWRSNLAR